MTNKKNHVQKNCCFRFFPKYLWRCARGVYVEASVACECELIWKNCNTIQMCARYGNEFLDDTHALSFQDQTDLWVGWMRLRNTNEINPSIKFIFQFCGALICGWDRVMHTIHTLIPFMVRVFHNSNGNFRNELLCEIRRCVCVQSTSNERKKKRKRNKIFSRVVGAIVGKTEKVTRKINNNNNRNDCKYE